MTLKDSELNDGGDRPLRVASVRLGMKVVTQANWLSPDPITLFSIGGPLDDDAGIGVLVSTGNYLAERFGELTLSSAVSEEAARLFHVSRGTLVYGIFFYPLIDVALERAYTAIEVETRETTATLGLTGKKRDSHADRINRLCRLGWISRQFCAGLHSVRWLRNHAVHDRQSIVGPGSASRTMSGIAADLEHLARVRQSSKPLHLTAGPEHDHYDLPWR